MVYKPFLTIRRSKRRGPRRQCTTHPPMWHRHSVLTLSLLLFLTLKINISLRIQPSFTSPDKIKTNLGAPNWGTKFPSSMSRRLNWSSIQGLISFPWRKKRNSILEWYLCCFCLGAIFLQLGDFLKEMKWTWKFCDFWGVFQDFSK